MDSFEGYLLLSFAAAILGNQHEHQGNMARSMLWSLMSLALVVAAFVKALWP